MSGALITGADSIKALVAARSLGRKQIAVYTADSKRGSLASFSRHSRGFYTYPPSGNDIIATLSVIRKILEKSGSNILLPVHSTDTNFIVKYRSYFEPLVKIPFHDYETISTVNNKSHLLKIAEEMGFPIPKTYRIESLSDLNALSQAIDFPAVIKLRESASSIGLSYVNTKDELVTRYKETIERFDLDPPQYPLIQEFISGEGYGVSLLFNHGDARAIFTHKRIREYPVSGGPSTCRVSVKMPGMERIALELMENFDWHGVAMVEFKLTPEKKPVIMEVNPRFWGSLNLPIFAGVEFPYLLYKMAVEGDVKPVFAYKTGIESRNAFIDTIALIKKMKKTGDFRLIKEMLQMPRNDDILSWDDPLPAISFLGRGLKEVFREKR